MNGSPKKLPKLLYTAEIILFLAAGFLIRAWVDDLTLGVSPLWLAFALKILVLFALIGLAVCVHLQMERWLRSRGWME